MAFIDATQNAHPQVVGSLPELGAWSPDDAPDMTWDEGHLWKLKTPLPKEPFEFKVCVHR